jgi:hypothetical protein
MSERSFLWQVTAEAGGLVAAMLPVAFAGYVCLAAPQPLYLLPAVFAMASAPVVAFQRKVHNLRAEVGALREAVARLREARDEG